MQSVLKIDMDWIPPDEWLLDWFNVVVYPVLSKVRCYWFNPKWEVSQSRKGLHIVIGLINEVSDEEALKLQFLLGDDRVRCRLNYDRLRAGVVDWNKLFVRKVKRNPLRRVKRK